MPIGKLVFAQLMDFLPLHTFRRCDLEASTASAITASSPTARLSARS